jgi:sulfur transfer complex TusBCD TusB component (DsrH family)
MLTYRVIPQRAVLRNNTDGRSQASLRNILDVLPIDEDLSARNLVETV